MEVLTFYAELWRDAFWHHDWLERLLARLALLCFHATLVCLLIALLAIAS